MASLFEQLILGLIQGIVEWLPFSSEGMLLLVQANFFTHISLDEFVRQALFLHLGTFFAAAVYFRKDIKELWQSAKRYPHVDRESKLTIHFLLVTTLISGVLGLAILQFLEFLDITKLPLTSTTVNMGVGSLLLFTGYLQLRAQRMQKHPRSILHLKNNDAILAGIAQGFAALPGLSRSGLTVSALLFRRIQDVTALRLSFLMSLPIVLLGNILLNIRDIALMKGMFFGMLVAFVVGLGTIHALMQIARKIRFGWFVVFMGIMMFITGILNFFY